MQENETPEMCIAREIMEELDLDIQVIRKLDAVRHVYPTFTIELLPFVCMINSGNLHLHEHSAFKWMLPDELSRMDLCEADKKIVPLLSRLDPIGDK